MSLRGQIEAKNKFQVALDDQLEGPRLEFKWRLEASLKGQVESKRRSECSRKRYQEQNGCFPFFRPRGRFVRADGTTEIMIYFHNLRSLHILNILMHLLIHINIFAKSFLYIDIHVYVNKHMYLYIYRDCISIYEN